MKIGRVKLERYKNLEDVEFDFKGQSAYILGQNGKGKSATIHALEMAIHEIAQVPNPIMSGKETANETVEFVDEKGNKYYAHIEYKKNKAGKVITKYVLKGEDGGSFTKKQERDNLFGARFKFDATEFVANQKTAAGRRKNLANVICPALGISIDDVKGAIDEMIESRKNVKREIKTYEEMFRSRGVNLTEVNTDLEKQDITALQKKYEAAAGVHAKVSSANEIIASAESKRLAHNEAASQYDSMAEKTWEGKKDAIQEKIKNYEKRIEEIMGFIRDEMDNLEKVKSTKPQEVIDLETKAEAEREKARQVVESASEAKENLKLAESGDLPNLEEIKGELDQAMQKNMRIDQIAGMKSDLDQMTALAEKLEGIEKDISAYKVEKGEFLAKACEGKLPEGYVIQLDEKYDPTLYYREGDDLLIFDDNQINTAKVMTGAVVLGMELMRDSKIQVICISRAESLDRNTREMILEECQKRDFQVIMERVDDDSELTVELIENAE